MVLYIISQVFVVISYALLACTYFGKDRKKILIMSFGAVLSNAIAFVLLGAWSGFAMSIVAMVRNIVFLLRGNKKQVDYIDWIILVILFAIIGVSSYFTYEGLFSLFSIFGTLIYSFSAWQKNPKLYKLLGIPSSICWVIYSVYVASVFGAILESVLLVFEFIGTVKAFKNKPEIQES